MACGGNTLVQAVMFAASNKAPSKAAARPIVAQNGLVEVESVFMVNLLQNSLEVVVNELQHAVHCRDGLGVIFVGALCFDHVDHFFNHVHVGGF